MRPGKATEPIDNVQGLSTLLKQAGVVFAAEDLIDALWLAGQMGEPEVKQTQAPEKSVADTSATVREQVIEVGDNEAEEDAFAELALPRTETQPESQSPQIEGIPIKAPAAPALRIRLELARALRPLRRKVPSPGRMAFDEIATVEQIANQNIWSPVLRPAPECWLDLALVIEDTPSLVLWKETIREFQMLVERQGAFRRVTTWRLRAHEQRSLALFKNWKKEPTRQRQQSQRPSQPEQLLDPAKRRLILLLSDCTSEAWRSGQLLDWLDCWGEQAPTAVVQFLPERLWSQTVLGQGVPMWLSALEPGVPSAKLRQADQAQLLQQLLSVTEEQASSRKKPQKITVPIIPLEAEPLKQWAKVVAGAGEVRTTGVEFDRTKFSPSPSAASSEGQPHSFSAQERVQRFRTTASLMAQRLAGLMAAAPVDPVIVDLIRQTLLREAEPVHVAEVFMGGLMDAKETENGLRYNFPSEVRGLLIDTVPKSKKESVLDAVSVYIGDRLGRNIRSFEALLGVDFSGDAEAEGLVVPFAQVAAQVLARMGDEYAALAEQVRMGQTVAPPPRREEAEDMFPPLQMFKFREATLEFSTLIEIQPDDPLSKECRSEPSQNEYSPQAHRLESNRGYCFLGVQALGEGFLIDPFTAKEWIKRDSKNREVLKPYFNGATLARSPGCIPEKWIIDFDDKDLEEASQYNEPFFHVENLIKPLRIKSKRTRFKEQWWLYGQNRSAMRRALEEIEYYLAVPNVYTNCIFFRLSAQSIPGNTNVVVASEDDYILGILLSYLHREWSREQSRALRRYTKYTPQECFETFPFPQEIMVGQARRIRVTTAQIRACQIEQMEYREIGLSSLYKRDFDRPQSLLYKLHRKLDKQVADAYQFSKDRSFYRQLLELNHYLFEKEQNSELIVGPWDPSS